MRIKNVIGWNLVPDDVWVLMQRQATAIAELNHLREQDQLTYARNLRDLLASFRGALEHEDQERIREILDAAITDMADEVARSEEHLV